MAKPFLYNKSIDQKVVRAATEVLKTSVDSIKKINQGVVNHVYKVSTSTDIFIVKVFRYRYWPEDGKLEWIEKQMRKHHVPHAKVIYYSRASKYFPYGFMVSEYIEGLHGWEAISKHKHSLFDSWKESGKLLKKIHSIHGKKFGHVNNGEGSEKNFITYESNIAKEKLDALVKQKRIGKEMAHSITATAEKILRPFEKRFKPVLVHGDASRDNSILSTDGKFILIDWDNAKLSIPLWDFFVLTSWMPVMPKWKNKATRTKAKQAFFRGYGSTDFTQEEIKQIEPGIHLLFYAGLLKFYTEKGQKYYERRILKMIKNVLANY